MTMATERRSFPRYPVSCEVEVRLPEGEGVGEELFAARCNNLSRTSIQIECGPDLVVALLQQQKLPYACQLGFAMPADTRRFSIPATVVTHRRLSQHQYVLVLILRHVDLAQEERLDRALTGLHPILPD